MNERHLIDPTPELLVERQPDKIAWTVAAIAVGWLIERAS
jgi:hypothetical protein